MTRSLVGKARSDGGLGDLRARRSQINDATDQRGGTKPRGGDEGKEGAFSVTPKVLSADAEHQSVG